MPRAVIVVLVALGDEVLPAVPIDSLVAHDHARHGLRLGLAEHGLVLAREIEGLLHVAAALVVERPLRHIKEAAESPVHNSRRPRQRGRAVQEQLLTLHRVTEPSADTVALHVLAVVLRVRAYIGPDDFAR